MEKRKKAQYLVGFKPMASLLQGMLYTSVQQPLPYPDVLQLSNANLNFVPLSSSLEPEPKVFGVGSCLSMLPERQVNLLDGQALALRRVGVAELQA